MEEVKRRDNDTLSPLSGCVCVCAQCMANMVNNRLFNTDTGSLGVICSRVVEEQVVQRGETHMRPLLMDMFETGLNLNF